MVQFRKYLAPFTFFSYFTHCSLVLKFFKLIFSLIIIIIQNLAQVPPISLEHLCGCVRISAGVHLWYFQWIGHDLKRHTPVNITSHGRHCMSEHRLWSSETGLLSSH